MQTLQQMIDDAFPGETAERAPQRPSEAFVARERSFAETATRVESLRQARLAGDQPVRSILFEVVRHRGSWRVLHRGKHSSPLADQSAAVAAAIKQAKAKREAGFPVEVRLIRTDGEIVVQPLDDEVSPAPSPEGDPA
jgi:hypothetical protein